MTHSRSSERPGLLEQDNYGVALREAFARFRSADLGLQAARAGAQTGVEGLRVRFFAQDVLARREAAQEDVDGNAPAVVVTAEGREPLPTWEQILVLHYLLGASDGLEAERDSWLSYRELPDAAFYDSAFRQQVCQPLAERFGHDPGALQQLVGRWDSAAGDIGDASLVLPAFPRVRLWVQVWQGDEDFPAEANLLFSRSAAGALTAEDAAVLGDAALRRMLSAAGPPA